MEIIVQHQFPAPREQVLAALASPLYAAHLARGHSFFAQIEPLRHEEDDAGWRREVRYHGRPFITRLGMFSLPAAWFSWIEHSQYDRARGELSFANVPLVESARDKLVNRGVMHFHAQEGATVREARFEIDFQVAAMYRPLKEVALTMMRRQVIRSLDEEAALLTGWLSQERVAA
ncbi:MAG TPA: hypothetical protein VI299_19830 [Polyangiales bacterium]